MTGVRRWTIFAPDSHSTDSDYIGPAVEGDSVEVIEAAPVIEALKKIEACDGGYVKTALLQLHTAGRLARDLLTQLRGEAA